ncbi:MAG: DNA-directed RNA polymerase subunit omega [Acidobacteriota bacterium]
MDERIPDKIDSKFRYVLVAAHRAEQLTRGGRPRIDGVDKPTSAAMAEVTQELVSWDYGPAPEAEQAEAEEAAPEETEEEVH